VHLGSSSERIRLVAFREALGTSAQVLRQNDDEDTSKRTDRFWFIAGGSGHITLAPAGGFLIATTGTPAFVQWARSVLPPFCTIRRTGVHSLLAEIARLPDAQEAAVLLRQVLGVPLARAVWLCPDRHLEVRA
jgi:hypothetical protein